MKEKIHPTWYPEATVICACGNTWKTGATTPELRTDICSACHPFYTGEQRIVDTEGQVDRFMKRLQQRDNKRVEAEERAAAKTPMNLSLSELGVSSFSKRHAELFSQNGITTVGDLLQQFEQENGEEKLLEVPGIGRKVMADLKKALRTRGYEFAGSAQTTE